uniref:ferroxidase n=1 Tax=Anolis carolinensis TaxID=28377 RepID=A0A803SNH6_ANOCA
MFHVAGMRILQAVALVHFAGIVFGDGSSRAYYLGIHEEEWNYAPVGKNGATGQSVAGDDAASRFLQRSRDRIGSVYRKSVYRQYSDATYASEVPKPPWLGFLGPVIRAEVGDTVSVHLKNFARRPFSIHPHGVFYKKDSEGSLYPDVSSQDLKVDDAVPPGGSYTYVWTVPEDHGPTASDPSCLTWIYHSHVNAPRDIASGLIGPLLVCREGNRSQRRHDADLDFFLMFSVVDENESWHLRENVASFCGDPDSVDEEDEGFKESNRMHAINGFAFGSLPELSMCAGDHVSWHLFGMGSERDVHTAFFHGQTLVLRGHRTDVVSLFPATFVAAEMTPRNTGKWLLSCEVHDHLQAGMEALYEVKNCSYPKAEPPLKGKLRKYYIAAKEVQWNYAPSGLDQSTGKSLQEPNSFSELYFKPISSRSKGTYWKAKYIEYTDETFRVEKAQKGDERHLGILGPVIKAEVGDTLQVTFANKASWPFSVQPHGVFYGKEWEGTPYDDGLSHKGTAVRPMRNFTYRWTVPQHVGPTDTDPSCLTWMYSSATDPTRDTNAGLVGPLLVCRPGTLDEENHQKGVDKEFYLLFGVFDENLSWYRDANLKTLNRFSMHEDEVFKESNRMHAINGFVYSNLPLLEVCKGETVSWHLLGFGGEADIHGIAFQGNTILMNGMRRDTTSLFPHTFATALMQPDEEGAFEVYCQTSNHYQSGMKGRYSVRQCGKETPFDNQVYEKVRTFYIMAEEVEWDYAPDRSWELERHNRSAGERYGEVFLSHGNGLLGSKYKKAIYREYTDGTFRTQKERRNGEEHLGILGPFLWAEVGDVLNIVFRNNATRPYSIHAHGVLEKKLVPHCQPYMSWRWAAPCFSFANGSVDLPYGFSSRSASFPVQDLFSGLVGPLKVCRKGTLDSGGRRRGVSKEFALLFLVFDENQSWYLEENVKNHGQGERNRSRADKEEFAESNKMHAINGRLYANLPGLTMYAGDWVNWYLLGMGQEIDVHTSHRADVVDLFPGTLEMADVVDLFPGTLEMVEMLASNPGTWLLHCHVADHIHAGMETLFTVLPRPGREGGQYQVPDDPDHVVLFGSKLAHGKVEATVILLAVAGIALFLIAIILLGIIIHRERQRRLRRNRRSILDEGFKLVATKSPEI